DPVRLAALSLPFLREAGMAIDTPDAAGLRWIESVLPMATESVDRLDEVPSRLRLVFEYDAARAVAREDVRAEFASDQARAVVRALADVLEGWGPLFDRETFRAAAGAVRERTQQKGR